MTTRTELIARLRAHNVSVYQSRLLAREGADMLEADGVERQQLTLGWNAANVDVLHHAMTIEKLREAARLALDAIVTGRGKHEAIAALKEALK